MGGANARSKSSFFGTIFYRADCKNRYQKKLFIRFMRQPLLGARIAKVGTKVTPQIAQTFAPAGRPAVTISALENV